MDQEQMVYEKMRQLRRDEAYDIFVTAAVVKVGNFIEKSPRGRLKIKIPAVDGRLITKEQSETLEKYLNYNFKIFEMGYFLQIKKCPFRRVYKIKPSKIYIQDEF